MVKYILSYFLCCGCFNAISQTSTSSYPTRTAERMTLDGKLDERVWQRAESWSSFLQFLPKIGGECSERTDIRILYDDNFLYIGITAYDSASSQIIATGLERDVYYGSDDHVCITLDTYNDKRQAVLISTNALGARFDEEVYDNGNGFNAAFNTFWDVRTARNEDGYTAEFQIPFSSLRFEQAQQVKMGIKVLRYIKRKNEYDIFPISDPTVANAVWRVNNSQEITFVDLKTRKPFYFIPYIKADYQQSKVWNVDEMKVNKQTQFIHRNLFSQRTALDKLISNIGFDVKYGLSKNFTLDVTANTDFAQAESDNRVLNFTRFAVNLPEKRNFFLESRDYLGFTTGSGMLLFNSRAIGIDRGVIVPIIGGVRLSGKSNGFQLGFLDLQTTGNQSVEIDPQHFSVLRLRKEVWGNGSYIGGVITNRMSTQQRFFNNQTIGIDAMRRFKDNKFILGANIALTSDQTSSASKRLGHMLGMNLSRTSSIGYNHTSTIEYTDRNFKPRVGFAPDSAYVLANMSNGYIWKWRESKTRNLYWFTHLLNYKYRTINNKHESIYSELEIGSSYTNGATLILTPLGGREYLPYDWMFANDVVIPVAYYSYSGVKIRYDSKQTKKLNYKLTGQYNGFYGGVRYNLLINGYYAISKKFRFTYKYEFNAFKFPQRFSTSLQEAYQSNLIALGFNYTQSIYFSVKAFVQYDDISGTIGSNFRVRINPREGTDLYIVYNPTLNTAFPRGEGRNSLMVDQQAFIVKFTKAFNL